MKTDKKIIQDPTPVPTNNPYIDESYIGDPDDLMAQLRPRQELYKKGLVLRKPFVYQSTAFFTGQQNMWWNTASSRMESIPISDISQSTAINNRILNKCRAVIQRLVSFDPTSQCVPASPSAGDIYSARLAKKLVESNHHDVKLGYRAVYEEFAEHVVIEGMGWIRTEWDAFGGRATVTYKEQPSWVEVQTEASKEGESSFTELGEYLDHPMEELHENGQDSQKTNQKVGAPSDQDALDGGESSSANGDESATSLPTGDESQTPDEPQTNQPNQGKVGNQPKKRTLKLPAIDPETGKQKKEPIRDANGKVQLDEIKFDGCVKKVAVGALALLYNPLITRWEEAFDTFEEEYLSIDDVKNKYPTCSDISESDYETNDANPWLQLIQINLGKSPMGTNIGIKVTTYFCKSCVAFPRGLKVVIIKDKIRVGIPMPVLNGDSLPYDFAGYIHIPGTFNYISLPMYLMPPQSILNKLLRQQIDHAKQFAVPKILMRDDQRFQDTVVNGVQILKYSANGPAPQFANPQANSSAHMELIKYMDDALDTNSGINKTAEGNPPPNVTSGDMAEAITENDYQIHMLDIDRVAAAITGSCNKEIRAIKEYGADEIIARYIGPGGRWTVSKFKKANLRIVSDVMFIPGKAANLSRGQQRKDLNMILPIVTQGQGTPDQQKKIIDQAIEFGMWGEEEAFVSFLEQQKNCALDILAEMDANSLNPQYDATKLIMPWMDMAVWKDVIEGELLNYTEFNQKPEITKKRLIDLWNAVRVTFEKQTGGGTPQAGAPQPKPPVGAPQGAPPGMGAPGLPPQGAPQPQPMIPPQNGAPQAPPQPPEMAGAPQ